MFRYRPRTLDLNWVYALGLQALSVLALVYLLTLVASVPSTAAEVRPARPAAKRLGGDTARSPAR